MTTSEKAAWAAMIGLAVLGGLLLVAIALGSAAGDAVEQALAEPMAQSTQRSTQVCVGLFNLGACRNTQTSTSTAITPKNSASGIRPWSRRWPCTAGSTQRRPSMPPRNPTPDILAGLTNAEGTGVAAVDCTILRS